MNATPKNLSVFIENGRSRNRSARVVEMTPRVGSFETSIGGKDKENSSPIGSKGMTETRTPAGTVFTARSGSFYAALDGKYEHPDHVPVYLDFDNDNGICKHLDRFEAQRRLRSTNDDDNSFPSKGGSEPDVPESVDVSEEMVEEMLAEMWMQDTMPTRVFRKAKSSYQLRSSSARTHPYRRFDDFHPRIPEVNPSVVQIATPETTTGVRGNVSLSNVGYGPGVTYHSIAGGKVYGKLDRYESAELEMYLAKKSFHQSHLDLSRMPAAKKLASPKKGRFEKLLKVLKPRN